MPRRSRRLAPRTVASLWRSATQREREEAIREVLAHILREWPGWEEIHRQRALLDAYRLRRRWRKADAWPLVRLGISRPALRYHLASCERRRGRGVVGEYRSLAAMLRDFGRDMQRIVDPSRQNRRSLLMATPWWADFVEAAYRGEFEAAKRARPRAAAPELRHEKLSEIAEQKVATIVGISTRQVRRLCQQARDQHVRGQPPSPAISADELDRLIATGVLPDR